MGYNKKFLNEALNEIKSKGEKKRLTYDIKRNIAANENPRLKEIDNEIMKLGPMIGISAVSGNNDRVVALKNKCKALANERNEILLSLNINNYEPLCKKCNDTGYCGVKLCDCVLKRAKELSYKALSEEMPIEQSTFENFRLDYYDGEAKTSMKKNLDFCKKYANELNKNSSGLLLFGGTGLGKTHISLAIAAAAIEKGLGTVYSPTQNLLQKLEREHFSYSDVTPLLDDVLSCDLLILDDLGAEFSTSFTQALIYNIINTRILAKKPTVISTNLSVEEIESKYTSRVSSRIIGCFSIRHFTGEDIRPKKRLEEIKSKK